MAAIHGKHRVSFTNTYANNFEDYETKEQARKTGWLPPAAENESSYTHSNRIRGSGGAQDRDR